MHKQVEVNGSGRGFAVVVFVKGPRGKTVLVEDPEKRPPFPKLPGGKKEGEETPRACAARELRGETGLKVKESKFTLVETINKGDHDFYFYMVTVKNFGGFREKGDEGEKITTVYMDRIAEMENFFRFHKNLLIKHDLIDVM